VGGSRPRKPDLTLARHFARLEENDVHERVRALIPAARFSTVRD
jgi:hypothetical protein